MKRIAVVGTSCAGKSTFSAALAQRAPHLRHVPLDHLFWAPNWTPVPLEEFRASVEQATADANWIVDGNYSKVRDIVWSQADTIIFLDYPFWIVGWRGVTRTLRRCWTQEELFAGNRESFVRSFLSHDSILLWVLQTHWRHRREYPRLFEQHPQVRHVITLKHPSLAKRFLASIG